jgi:hypothetical protein
MRVHIRGRYNVECVTLGRVWQGHNSYDNYVSPTFTREQFDAIAVEAVRLGHYATLELVEREAVTLASGDLILPGWCWQVLEGSE